MEIMFEKCLRDILVKRGKTQRELAEWLCISTQAVSKWCRGENMPDISLLPKIAIFLDVSVDDLLGVGKLRKQEKIREYQVKGFELAREGRNDERIEMWREAYNEFPNDMEVNTSLMYALYTAHNGRYHDEALALGERILRESTDEYQQNSAIQILCRIHSTRGNREKAKEYANMAGSLHMSKDVLLSLISDSDEGIEQNLELMLECLSILTDAEDRLCRTDNLERNLWLHEFSLKLLELFFDDGFYGVYALVAKQRHQLLAKIYLSHRKDEQKAYEHLEEAVKFAKQYDDLPDEPNAFAYTSTLLSGHKNIRTIIGIYTETECELLLSVLCDTEFDSIRGQDRFKAIVEELEAQKTSS